MRGENLRTLTWLTCQHQPMLLPSEMTWTYANIYTISGKTRKRRIKKLIKFHVWTPTGLMSWRIQQETISELKPANGFWKTEKEQAESIINIMINTGCRKFVLYGRAEENVSVIRTENSGEQSQACDSNQANKRQKQRGGRVRGKGKEKGKKLG